MKFAEMYLKGLLKENQIDDFVDKWHSSGDEVTEPLHEFLGLSWVEYVDWVKSGELFRPECYRDLRGEIKDEAH